MVKGHNSVPMSDMSVSLVVLNNKVTEPWDFVYKENWDLLGRIPRKPSLAAPRMSSIRLSPSTRLHL